MVIQDLFVTVTLVTLIHAVTGERFGKERQRIHWCGIVSGVIAAVILAFVKNTTNKIISSRWNHKIYIAIVLLTIGYLLLLLDQVGGFSDKTESRGSAGQKEKASG